MPGRRRRNLNAQITEFQRVIRERRLELRKSQAEIAGAIGLLSPEFISMVEVGIRKIDLNRVPDLARALQYDPSDLCRLALKEEAPALYEVLFPDDGGGPLREAEPESGEPILVSSAMGDLIRRLECLPAEVKGNIEALVKFLYMAYLKGLRLPGGIREDLSRGSP